MQVLPVLVLTCIINNLTSITGATRKLFGQEGFATTPAPPRCGERLIGDKPVTFTIPHGRHVPLHGWFFGRAECSSDNVVVMAVVVAAWFVAMTNDE
ncbi:hypothetical protein DAPPUDRAFT_248245 [Daphnia pulex]|uniref:Uncharacterized protein n=1 Tax=Daphnia pulex TaxID=6669 RepID=E9GU01_DAPPU|nr:hypothetical protein DAPPUDRAFT_248245 [Daphnia pulex]|eukprot:EFX76948.1 hypothetical protein DAPPUDRAFT_248245 [Daphnia pulex]